MKYNRNDLGKSGIYLIRNTTNNKIYVGKAKCILKRMRQHVTLLNRKSKDENPHLINAWHKYGRNSFEYVVLEYLEIDLLAERELFWITSLNALDSEVGYNLRLDSSTGMITSDETRQKLSEAYKLRKEKFPELSKQNAEHISNYWRNNPEEKEVMRSKLKKLKQKYRFLQYDKQKNLIKVWDTIEDIIAANPEYKWQNIYAVCNGYKPSIYGYVWAKELKI
jgi:group I intron endonuclease